MLNLIKQYTGEIRPAPPLPKPPAEKEPEQEGEREELLQDELHAVKEQSPKIDYVARGQEILDTAFEQAEAILASARERGEKEYRETMQKAEEDAEKLRQEQHKLGREQGHEQGYTEGITAGHLEGVLQGREQGERTARAENAEKLLELQALLETAQKERDTLAQHAEDDLSKLSISICKKILKRELELDTDSIRKIVEQVLEGYRNEEWIRIMVSPETAKTLIRTNHTIADALKHVSENIKVVPSPGMTDSDVMIEMADSAIDAGVDAQMEKIQENLNL